MRSEKLILSHLAPTTLRCGAFSVGAWTPAPVKQLRPERLVCSASHVEAQLFALINLSQSRHLLHNLCHDGLHLSAARSMKAQATSKRQLWQQNQKQKTSSRFLSVELIMCIVRMWITPSSNLYDIHIYTVRLSGSAFSFHTQSHFSS